MRKSFRVTIKIPEGMTVTDARDFIRDAVASWGGQYQPNVDPRFEIKSASVSPIDYEAEAKQAEEAAKYRSLCK